MTHSMILILVTLSEVELSQLAELKFTKHNLLNVSEALNAKLSSKDAVESE